MAKDFKLKFPPPKVKGNDKNEEQPSGTDESKSAIVGKDSEVDKNIEEKTNENIPPGKEKKSRNLSKVLENAESSVTSGFGENPFLQSKEHFDPASVIKTGYKMRTDYKRILKLMAEMKKGYTIEALLDDALSMYIKNSPDADKAIQMMLLMK